MFIFFTRPNDVLFQDLQDTSSESADNADHPYNPTAGIDISKNEIKDVGIFRIWDLAGHVEYHVSHAMFLGAENAIFIVVYNLIKTLHEQDVSVFSFPPATFSFWSSSSHCHHHHHPHYCYYCIIIIISIITSGPQPRDLRAVITVRKVFCNFRCLTSISHFPRELCTTVCSSWMKLKGSEDDSAGDQPIIPPNYQNIIVTKITFYYFYHFLWTAPLLAVLLEIWTFTETS